MNHNTRYKGGFPRLVPLFLHTRCYKTLRKCRSFSGKFPRILGRRMIYLTWRLWEFQKATNKAPSSWGSLTQGRAQMLTSTMAFRCYMRMAFQQRTFQRYAIRKRDKPYQTTGPVDDDWYMWDNYGQSPIQKTVMRTSLMCSFRIGTQ